ncbi:hypothetical protein [Methylococcus sp. EFPC2]|uniref:hypothetical protein n=1 Tax=Methylococcus sp. EFPC2 TaxID=2812648 RepID=UPI001967822D|nr:hypothetical protein [Methylococcus sp. EFPC2]QSA98559.1 hypothetical protein JWZ97_07110 [Methylococcus sp. EFPC2]
MNARVFFAIVIATMSISLARAEVLTVRNVEFDLAPSLAHDPIVNNITKVSWEGRLDKLLSGYNYGMVLNADGSVSRVIVSGRNGSAEEDLAPAAKFSSYDDLLVYQGVPASIPKKYREAAAGSVSEVSLPVDRLQQMKLGEKIALNLPVGAYTLVHDNRFEHENGDVTWVGYLEGAGKGYRVIITSGNEGSLGQIVTPEGVYNIDLEEGRNWLVDLGAAGLQANSSDSSEEHGSMGVTVAEADTLMGRPEVIQR